MTDIAQYTALKTIVSYFLDETGKGIQDFDRCWILGFRALVEMHMDISGQTVTDMLLVPGNKIVPFPSNCLQWSKIGIMDGNGQLNALRINNALTNYADTHPNRLGKLTPQVNDSTGTLYFNNYYHQGNCYQLFGNGNGIITHGECAVDEKKRLVILPPDFAYDRILFEYVDCPEKNDDYQVLTCLQEAIIAFIKWKLKLGPREEFYAAVITGRRKLPKKRVHLQSVNQVIRESQGFKLRS